MSYFNQYKELIIRAVQALHDRSYFTPYPEHPKAYDESENEDGRNAFSSKMNHNFEELGVEAENWLGEEVSPFLQTGIGIKYPAPGVSTLIERANNSKSWAEVNVEERAGILVESLERVKKRFFELAYSTMHTSGQSFMMAFQASGPHSNDRALEAIAMGYYEITRFPSELDWVKPMGKYELKIHKTWKAMPKGIGLVIGCSTFPTWNTVPGMYASLITGNPVIVKPHPKSIYPIALVIAELRNVLREEGLNPDICQMAPDTINEQITKDLAEHPDVKLIDYTGGSSFGDYLETLKGKVTFTEKSGVNSIILHSVNDLDAVIQNIAMSTSLYSGQMCTAPQDVFIPAEGVHTPEGVVSFDEVADKIGKAVTGLAGHPKFGAGTVAAIQNEQTIKRIKKGGNFGGQVVTEEITIVNPEFEHARTASPIVVKTKMDNTEAYEIDYFGPIVFAVEMPDINTAISTAADLARNQGAITCLAFTTDAEIQVKIEREMNAAYTPVSFNFTGAAMVNQHAAFSDFHTSGGNPAGNATFVNPEYINKRFVWVGNRYA